MKTNTTFTAILIKDKKSEKFTAYISEMPEVITEGSTEDEVKSNLIEALDLILDVKVEELLLILKNPH